MLELIDKVIGWATDRNIFEGSNVVKQLDKTSEEFNELQRATAVLSFITNDTHPDYIKLAQARADVEDAYGDILVTLIIASAMQGITLDLALERAYDVIKDRKGRMVNGKFVKEEDL